MTFDEMLTVCLALANSLACSELRTYSSSQHLSKPQVVDNRTLDLVSSRTQSAEHVTLSTILTNSDVFFVVHYYSNHDYRNRN